MGKWTYLAFTSSLEGEAHINTIYSLGKIFTPYLVFYPFETLIKEPARLVESDGYVLRFWPAKKWLPDQLEHIQIIEQLVRAHPDKFLLLKHGEKQSDGHDSSGCLHDAPFSVSVEYPRGREAPYFAYYDASGQRLNTKDLLQDHLASGRKNHGI